MEKEIVNNAAINIPDKYIKVLSSSKWYHATTFSNYTKLRQGIIVDWNKGHSHDLDFGYGFYLTVSEKLAESFISRLLAWKEEYQESEIPKELMPVVIEFEAIPAEWFLSTDFNTKLFSSFDDEFAEFVFRNRTENYEGNNQHSFDAIYGVMSDSLPAKLIVQYSIGELSRDEVIAALKKNNSMKQLSLHKQELCDMLKIKRAYLYNFKTFEREELDINE